MSEPRLTPVRPGSYIAIKLLKGAKFALVLHVVKHHELNTLTGEIYDVYELTTLAENRISVFFLCAPDENHDWWVIVSE